MNGKWIEIFRGGEQADSQGRKHDGDKMIDTALALFNAEEHEPPVVIGHPKDNAPAFGWVASLKKEGNSLFAKFKDAQPEFVDMVERGLFKKRSAAFYPDGSLRHVGFLGAMPPAVKGLADIKFNDDEDALVFEFSDCSPQGKTFHDDFKFRTLARVFGRLRDFLIERFDLETADKIVDSFDLDLINTPPEEESPLFSQPDESEETMKATTFSEAEMEEAKKKAADEARAQAGQEFAEKEKANDDKLEKLQKEFAEKKAKDHKKSIANFVESGVKAGTILPAWEKTGLGQFMESLDDETTLEFSEGEGKTVERTQLAQFKEFLSNLPRSVDFSEISDGDAPASSNDLDKLTKEFAEKNGVEYKEALIEVGRQRPDLVGK